MEQLKLGIIGCGNVTEVKSGPAFNKLRAQAWLPLCGGMKTRQGIMLSGTR